MRTGSPSRRETLRAVDGCRSSFFNALKRRVRIAQRDEAYRAELAEQREILVPWIRVPLFTYWRLRVVHAFELAPIEVVARTFLETGHVPAQWFL